MHGCQHRLVQPGVLLYQEDGGQFRGGAGAGHGGHLHQQGQQTSRPPLQVILLPDLQGQGPQHVHQEEVQGERQEKE